MVLSTDESSCGEHEEVENDSHFGKDSRLVRSLKLGGKIRVERQF